MKRIALLSDFVLAFVFVLAGCGAGGNSGGATTPANTATTPEVSAETTGGQVATRVVALNPQNDSNASGTATFTEIPTGVEVTLTLEELPTPGASYLAHIHPGSCAEAMTEEETGGQGENTADQEETSATVEAEIEYPLQPIYSNSAGNGTSTTDLPNVTIHEFLSSSSPKVVNVHNAGAGEPPPIACGDLNGGGAA